MLDDELGIASSALVTQKERHTGPTHPLSLFGIALLMFGDFFFLLLYIYTHIHIFHVPHVQAAGIKAT